MTIIASCSFTLIIIDILKQTNFKVETFFSRSSRSHSFRRENGITREEEETAEVSRRLPKHLEAKVSHTRKSTRILERIRWPSPVEIRERTRKIPVLDKAQERDENLNQIWSRQHQTENQKCSKREIDYSLKNEQK